MPMIFLFNSLFIWRFLPWLGPYGLAEMRTSFFPQQMSVALRQNISVLKIAIPRFPLFRNLIQATRFALNPLFTPPS